MKITRKNAGTAIGISAISLAAFTVLYILVLQVDFFPGSTYTIVFDYVGTINKGSIVRKSGLKIGSVRSLRISEEDYRSVIVRISLDRGHTVRTQDSFAIVTRGILGDQYVEVFPGPPEAAVATGNHIFQGAPMLDFNSLVVQGGALMQNLVESTAMLNRVLTGNEVNLNRTIGSIEKLTADLALITSGAEEIRSFVPEIREELADSMKLLSESVASLTGETTRVIRTLDTEIEDTMTVLTRSLASVAGAADALTVLLSNLNREDSVLGRLQQEDTAEDIVQILRNVEQTTANLMTASEEIRRSIEELLGSGDVR